MMKKKSKKLLLWLFVLTFVLTEETGKYLASADRIEGLRAEKRCTVVFIV